MRYPRPMQLALLIPALAAAALSEPVAAERDQADQRRAEPVQHRQRLLQAAGGPDVGIDERGRIDKDGKSIWVAERCGANSCLDRATGKMSPIRSLKFDATGKLVKSFGAGMLDLPARHPRRSRRQHLGDRRPGQRAAAARAARRRAAAGRRQPRRRRGPIGPRAGRDEGHIRSSSSARTASCC